MWLAGRYELTGRIGGGGMGLVYRAEDRVLGRTVAIKVLPLGAAADSSSVARFEREARAAASLFHPNIVSVFDAGSDEMTRFIVMEHVSGFSLADLLARIGRLPVDRAVALATQIASGLAAAHRAGVVHRDVKPANVMIDESGTVKLVDFGIARASAGTTLTQAGSVVGSALYIAPEVALGGEAEERSDVYSLGCVLYEMVTGRPPFTGELDAAVLHQHATARPRPPRALADGIPPALDSLIMQTLSKRPTERPSAAALVTALDRTVPRTPREARPAEDRRPAAQETAPLAPVGRTWPRRRARLGIAALVVTLLLAVAFAAGAFDWGSGAGPSETAATAAALHGGGRGDRGSWRLASTATGAFRAAGHLVAIAVAAFEAARAPAPTPAPAHRAPAAHKPHRPTPHRTHGHGNRHVELPPSEAPQPQAPASGGEAVAPTAGGPTETPPAQTAPAEAPPPPSTSGAPAP